MFESTQLFTNDLMGSRDQGSPVGNDDLLFAAHALYQGLTLVTNNTKEFNRVPDLLIENGIEADDSSKPGKPSH